MEELVLTRKQRLAGNLTAGAAVIAAGLVLLLAGADVIKADVKVLAAPVLLSAVGLSLLVTALIQRNVVSLWVSFAFTVPALVSFLAAFTSVGYKELYHTGDRVAVYHADEPQFSRPRQGCAAVRRDGRAVCAQQLGLARLGRRRAAAHRLRRTAHRVRGA